MAKLKFTILERDLKDAVPCDDEHCVVAEALKRINPGVHVSVASTIRLNGMNYVKTKEVQDLMTAFDAEEVDVRTMLPMTVELEEFP